MTVLGVARQWRAGREAKTGRGPSAAQADPLREQRGRKNRPALVGMTVVGGVAEISGGSLRSGRASLD